MVAQSAEARRIRHAWLRWLAATQELGQATRQAAPGYITLGGLLFMLACGVYVFTRLYHVVDYPIYFFGDEAAQVLFGERLIENGFRDAHGVWFPMYFEEAASRWTPLVSVYFQAAALSLFGKSVFVTRATAGLVSLLAIGPKDSEPRLMALTQPRVRLILYSTAGLLPLAVLLIGGVVWWNRR